MTIPTECDQCFGSFDIPDKYAGKAVRCKQCGATIRVPTGQPADVQAINPYQFDDSTVASDLPVPHNMRRRSSRSSSKKSASAGGLAKVPLIVSVLFLVLLPVAFLSNWFAEAYVALCVWTGLPLYIWGQISLLVAACKDGAIAGLTCFFLTPFYVMYAAFKDWSRIAQPMYRIFTALGLFFAGLLVGITVAEPVNPGVTRQPGRQPFRQIQRPRILEHQIPGNDRSPFLLNDAIPNLPKFSTDAFKKSTANGVDIYHLRQQNPPGNGSGPAERTQLRVYLPAGVHQKNSLPCVLVPPAGTPLMTGSTIDTDPANPEHIPYVQAGYAVITFTLDGATSDPDPASLEEFSTAYQQFRDAAAGMMNARFAFLFAQRKLSMVDPNRIYIAGHSSAATLSLLYASHEPKLAGCIAYAPTPNVEAHLADVVRQFDQAVFPGLKEFSRRSSPITHATLIRCPLFVYHATGDTVTDFRETKAYCNQLGAMGKDITFVEGTGDDHYQTMISEGIPAALEWLSRQVDSTKSSSASPFVAVRPNRKMSSPLNANSQPMKTTEPPAEMERGTSLPDTSRVDPKALIADTSRTNRKAVPAGTIPVQADMELTQGMRVVARRHPNFRWQASEVVEVKPNGDVTVHFLQLPSAFDKVIPKTQLRLSLPPDQIDEKLLRNIKFDIRHYFRGQDPDEAAIEAEFLTMLGYMPGSLKFHKPTNQITLQVIRDSRADKLAVFPLSKAGVAAKRRDEPE